MNCYKKTLVLLAFIAAFFLSVSATLAQTAGASVAQQIVSAGTTGNLPSGPRIWLQDRQPLPVQHMAAGQGTGSPVDLSGLGHAQPVSMTSGDLDADGFDDLVVGYSTGNGGYISIHRGNMDAFAPQSDASFQAIGRGEFPSPFQLQAQTFSVGVSPDFVALGDFTGQGNKDLAVAAKGGNALYIFPNDGKGNFGTPQTVNLGSGITALTTSEMGKGQSGNSLLVGLSTGHKGLLMLLGSNQQGFAVLSQYPLGGPITSIAVGDLDGDTTQDAAIVAGGQVYILHGGSGRLQSLALPFSASGIALGSFVFDRDSREQIAVLTGDGSIHIAAHSALDPRSFSKDEITA